jgi:RimJ/RimL family protein N-acetyltransferase
MLDIVATGFGVMRFIVIAERRNTRSIRLAERLGFVEVSPAAADGAFAVTDMLMQKVLP